MGSTWDDMSSGTGADLNRANGDKGTSRAEERRGGQLTRGLLNGRDGEAGSSSRGFPKPETADGDGRRRIGAAMGKQGPGKHGRFERARHGECWRPIGSASGHLGVVDETGSSCFLALAWRERVAA